MTLLLYYSINFHQYSITPLVIKRLFSYSSALLLYYILYYSVRLLLYYILCYSVTLFTLQSCGHCFVPLFDYTVAVTRLHCCCIILLILPVQY